MLQVAPLYFSVQILCSVPVLSPESGKERGEVSCDLDAEVAEQVARLCCGKEEE